MYSYRKIGSDLYWVGSDDRRIHLFENVFPVPDGISYNSYLITGEQNVLLDTVDKNVSGVFFENIEELLDGRSLDYVVINHMEPDHAATLAETVRRYPDVKIVGNAKTMAMIKQFFRFDVDSRSVVVKENDELSAGRHKLVFYMAPMVHWPEVMVTYDSTDKTLFSADAFGTFGALNGNVFADETDFDRVKLAEARRYYSNIVGKFGISVQALLKKAQGLDIKTLCPLHGPVWRDNIGLIAGKYDKWSRYEPEEKAVMIAYSSIYGGTENAASIIAARLGENGVRNIAVYDVSLTHPSYIVAEAFRCSHLVFAGNTYNGGIFCNMETLLNDLKAHALQNRTVALVENGSWSPVCGRLMAEHFNSMKNISLIGDIVCVKSTVKNEQRAKLTELADLVCESM